MEKSNTESNLDGYMTKGGVYRSHPPDVQLATEDLTMAHWGRAGGSGPPGGRDNQLGVLATELVIRPDEYEPSTLA